MSDPLFLNKKLMVVMAVVSPKVGNRTTMNSRYQKVFFMMAWFSADRVQCPSSRSL